MPARAPSSAAAFAAWLHDRSRLGARGTAVLLLVLLALAVALPWLLYQGPLRNKPSHATRYAVSGALGVLHGRGLTVAQPEALAMLDGVEHERDLLPLWMPEAEREPSHEPMPGVPLIFAGIAKLLGRLQLSDVVALQVAGFALLCAALYLALRPLDPLAAGVAAFGWALFVPQYRVTLTPGHDAIASLAYLGSLLPMLQHWRTGSLASVAVAGVVCGLGLWLREFFLLLPPIYAVLLLGFSRRRLASLAVFLVPVALFAAALASFRAPQADEGVDHHLTRGGMWHNFFTGVGQFSNPLGLEGNDASVRIFAERVSGDDFDFPQYQFDPRYNEVLSAQGEPYVREHWPSLLRNGVYRIAWLFFPAVMPSDNFAASLTVRALLVLGWIPGLVLAALGAVRLARRDLALALLVLAPWLSLFPLAFYTFNAKVPTQVFFSQVVLMAFAVGDGVRRLAGRRETAALAPRGADAQRA